MPRWTPEARRKQAEKIRQWKPWESSTGPVTGEGKAKASRNSLKHGWRSAESIWYLAQIKQQRDKLREFISLTLGP